jgi:hypothetical protein
MRASTSLLLVLGFAAFAQVAVIGAASKIPNPRPHAVTKVDAYARPAVIADDAAQLRLLRDSVWSQYRADVEACGKEHLNLQDACLQQARRERKQNSGMSKKLRSPKPKQAKTQIASVD